MIQTTDVPKDGETSEEKGTLLPNPSGYKLLCVLPDVSTKLSGTAA
jgi:hypothetical protein